MKKNPTYGELEVFGGKLIWIVGSIIVVYELIKSIVYKNLINEWKFILALTVSFGILGLGLYSIGKYRIRKGKEEKDNKN